MPKPMEKNMGAKKQQTPPTPASGSVNTDLAYGIYQGHYVTYKILADGSQQLWSRDGATLSPAEDVPAGSVTRPVMGVTNYLTTTVYYWVDGAARKIVYKPAEYFGRVVP